MHRTFRSSVIIKKSTLRKTYGSTECQWWAVLSNPSQKARFTFTAPSFHAKIRKI